MARRMQRIRCCATLVLGLLAASACANVAGAAPPAPRPARSSSNASAPVPAAAAVPPPPPSSNASSLPVPAAGAVPAQSGGIYPRWDVAEVDNLDLADPYRNLMLLAWHEMTTNDLNRRDPRSFWALAGVHGKSWDYNGETSSGGFCRHRNSGFAAWHRAYIRAFEIALIDAAHRAAAQFQDAGLRETYQRVAPTIRLPYWDWTAPSVPRILWSSRVNVVGFDGQTQAIPNPFRWYEYTANAGGGRSAGRTVRRGGSWVANMEDSSWSFGRQMSNFVRSNNWRCTYVSSRSCAGNLEATHNTIHSILGGGSGEMSTVSYAGFDPLFWVHHSMIDRCLWLFQNNAGQWRGASRYVPFLDLEGDTQDLASYGYTYGNSVAGRVPQSAANAASAAPSDIPVADVGAVVGSPAATAAVRQALEAWSRGYHGYTYQLHFPALNEGQLGEAVQVLVFLRRADAAPFPQPRGRGGRAGSFDATALRLRKDFCGALSGFNSVMDTRMGAESDVVARSVDLTKCLLDAGRQPDGPPADAAAPAKGPAQPAVRLSDLRIVALRALDGRDVTERFDLGKPAIGWSLDTTETVGAVRASVAGDPLVLEALASAPAGFGDSRAVFSTATGMIAE